MSVLRSGKDGTIWSKRSTQQQLSALDHNPPSGRDFLAREGGECVEWRKKKQQNPKSWDLGQPVFGRLPENPRSPVSVERAWRPLPEELSHSIRIYQFPFRLFCYWASQERPALVQQYFCILGEKSDRFIILLRLNLKWRRHTASCKCSTTVARYIQRISTTRTYGKPWRSSNVKRHLQST